MRRGGITFEAIDWPEIREGYSLSDSPPLKYHPVRLRRFNRVNPSSLLDPDCAS